MTRPNYSFLTRKELLLVAYGLWEQIEELRREVEGLRSVRAAMETNIEEKWEVIEAMSRKGDLTMKKVFWITVFMAVCLTVFLVPSAFAGTSDVTLIWDHSVDLPYIDGYRVYYGTEPGKYREPIFVGKVTQYTIAGLADGAYYFVLTAIDSRGLESVPTPEVFCTLKTVFLPPTNLKLTFQITGSSVNENR